MRRVALVVGIGISVTIFCVGLFVAWPRGGVHVTINNHGPASLRDVIVHVTGNTHLVGDVKVGESRTVAVQAHGESHVEIEVADGNGHRSRQLVDCYFESQYYRGIIRVDFENGEIKRFDNRVEISIW